MRGTAVQRSKGTEIGLAGGANGAGAVGLDLVFLGLEVGSWDGHGGCMGCGKVWFDFEVKIVASSSGRAK